MMSFSTTGVVRVRSTRFVRIVGMVDSSSGEVTTPADYESSADGADQEGHALSRSYEPHVVGLGSMVGPCMLSRWGCVTGIQDDTIAMFLRSGQFHNIIVDIVFFFFFFILLREAKENYYTLLFLIIQDERKPRISKQLTTK